MISIFAASFVFIFVKAFQQMNVVGGHYKWVMPSSFAMAVCEVTIIVQIATAQTLWAALPMGLGAGLGAMLAMWVHGRFIRKLRT